MAESLTGGIWIASHPSSHGGSADDTEVSFRFHVLHLWPLPGVQPPLAAVNSSCIVQRGSSCSLLTFAKLLITLLTSSLTSLAGLKQSHRSLPFPGRIMTDGLAAQGCPIVSGLVRNLMAMNERSCL